MLQVCCDDMIHTSNYNILVIIKKPNIMFPFTIHYQIAYTCVVAAVVVLRNLSIPE